MASRLVGLILSFETARAYPRLDRAGWYSKYCIVIWLKFYEPFGFSQAHRADGTQQR